MNYQYFETPTLVKNNEAVYCPYVKINNKFINTPVAQPRHLDGTPAQKICVPNLSDKMYIPRFGLNYNENGKPVHVNFNEKSECYSDNTCQNKIENPYSPYMQN